MSRDELENWQPRSMRYESVEERLVLSADPLPALVLHGSLVGAVQQETVAYDHAAVNLQNVPSPTPLLSTVNATTGVNYVHNNYHLTGAGQTVAVIDSGIAYDHYNLGRGFGANYRVVGGWDFAENDANPYDDAPAGFHGTHVAGIIGSDHTTNTGVAPDVDLVALRVFNDSGQGNFAWVESALQWVIANRNSFENPITTVNMSLGVPSMNSTTIPNWTTLEDELRTLNAMGIFVAVSAGNDFAQFNAQGLSYPAVSQYVVPVASANDAGTAMSNFSQRDDRVLVAPGETITSTVPDALFSFNGVANDWASASGTSMASPYVAGASVLLRQAYWSIGVTSVNQQMIYDTLFDTADLIYDPVTAASYHFIDVQAAVASILNGGGGGPTQPPTPPTDGDATGNTSQTATQLGTLGHGSSFNGQIANSADKDFYRFTAATTGRITLTAAAASGLTTQWQLVGGGAQVQGQAMSFDVAAGQSYTVGITATSGTGNYRVAITLQTPAIDLGKVDFRTVDNVAINGERWYRLTAMRDGIFSAEARTGGQTIGIQLYNGAQQAIGSSNTKSGVSRADVGVAAGQVIFIKVSGNSADVDLLFSNALRITGSEARFFGTSGNDMFTLQAGTTIGVTVNGMYYSFSTAAVNQVKFESGVGNDTLQFKGTSFAENVELRSGNALIRGNNLFVNSNHLETFQFTGGGGNDTAKLFAPAVSPTTIQLAGQPSRSFSLTDVGLANLATEGGVTELGAVDYRKVDNVEIRGERWYRLTAMRDGLLAAEARTASGQRLGIQFCNSAEQPIGAVDLRDGFSRADVGVTSGQIVLVKVTGNSADTDLQFGNVLSMSGNQVKVFGTAADDTFTLRAGANTAITINGIYYSFSTAAFSQVSIDAGKGSDLLRFTGTSGNEFADVYSGFAQFSGAGFNYIVNNCENLQIEGGGGNDVATLWDSAGDDRLSMNPTLTRLQGSNFNHRVSGFNSVRANATAGGFDIANTNGLSGNANFSATGFEQLTDTSASLARELDALDLLYQSFSNWQ